MVVLRALWLGANQQIANHQKMKLVSPLTENWCKSLYSFMEISGNLRIEPFKTHPSSAPRRTNWKTLSFFLFLYPLLIWTSLTLAASGRGRRGTGSASGTTFSTMPFEFPGQRFPVLPGIKICCRVSVIFTLLKWTRFLAPAAVDFYAQ